MTRREWLMAGLLLLLALLSLLVPRCANAETSWPQDRAFIFYNSGLSSDLLDSLADRFTFAIGSGDESGAGADIDSLLARGSKFEWYAKYNSATDNKPPSTEHTYLSNADTLAAYGVDNVEAFYLHFIEDTIVFMGTSESAIDTIPGWNPDNVIDPATGEPYVANAASEDEARVKAFGINTGRYAVSFGDANARRMMIGFNAIELITPSTPAGVEPRGLFLDNAGALSFGVNGYAYPDSAFGPGTPWPRQKITSFIWQGGAVAEAPNNAQLNSSAFLDWYKETGDPYFQDLKTFLDTHIDDIFGGVQRYSMPNVANTYAWNRNAWEAMFVTEPQFAHMPLLEFLYSAWSQWGTSQPSQIHAKQKAAIEAGVGIFESGLLKASHYPHSREDEIEASIAGYLVHRPYIGTVTDPLQKTWFLGVNNWNPGDNSGVQQPPFSHCLNPIFDIDLGLPLGDPYEIATDVWCRKYELGIALIRHARDTTVELDPVVTVSLPNDYLNYIPLDKYMNQGTNVATWDIYEGQGKVFLNGDEQPPADFYGYLPAYAGAVTGTVEDVIVPIKVGKDRLLEARVDYNDVRIKSADEVDLKFDVAASTLDSITYWVEIPSLTTGLEIRLYTGYDLLTTLPGPDDMWDEYEAVYHAEDTPLEWSSLRDATANSNHSTFRSGSLGPWNAAYSVAGRFDKGISVDHYRVIWNNDIELRDDWSLSLWAKPNVGSGTNAILSGFIVGASTYYLAVNAQTNSDYPDLVFRPGGPERKVRAPNGDCDFTRGEWNRLDITYDAGPDTTLSIYKNGVKCSTQLFYGPSTYPWYDEFDVDVDILGKSFSGNDFGIACWMWARSDNGLPDQFQGIFDEYRLRGDLLDDNFIAVQAAAERDPVGWWTIGDYVLSSGQSVIPVITRVDGYRNVEGEQVTLTGTNFGTAGGSVMLGDSGTYANAAPLVTQSIQSWSDTEIVLNYTPGSYGIATAVYLFVIHSNGEVSNGIFVPRRPGSKLPPDVGGE